MTARSAARVVSLAAAALAWLCLSGERAAAATAAERATQALERANDKLRQRDYAGAIADLTTAIQLDPGNAGTYLLRAYAREFQRDDDGVIADCTKAVELAPTLDRAYVLRATAWRRKGEPDKAIADATEALRHNPRYPDAYSVRAQAKRDKRDFAGAFADCSEAIALDPKDPLLYASRGGTRDAGGDSAGAIADYTAAIQMEPGQAWHYTGRALASLHRNDFDAAIRDCTEALELDPGAKQAYNLRARARSRQGDLEGAIADFTEVIQGEPRLASAFTHRALLYYECGRFPEVLADLRRAYGLDGSDWALVRSWVVRVRMGQREAATESIRTGRRAARTGVRPEPGSSEAWAGVIARFLTGETAEDQLFQAASRPGTKDPREKRAEAYYYAGVRRLFDGDKAGSLVLLRRCSRSDLPACPECQMAGAELRTLLLGMRAIPLSEAERAGLHLKAGVGLAALGVIDGGPARRAGIAERDVLLSLGGKDATAAELGRLLDEGKLDDKLAIELLRQGQKQAAELPLGAW